MNIITIDFETYWSPAYSLSKLTPLEYVMGDEFEVISMAWQIGGGPPNVAFGEGQTRRALERLRPALDDGLLLAHNMTGFDAYVLAYRFGVRPRMWGDTLAMARPVHAKSLGSLSLAALVEHYKLGVKDRTALLNTQGKRLAQFSVDERTAMARYNQADVQQCYALFRRLKPHISSAEMWQIDTLVRMRTEPAFELDTTLLESTLARERERKHSALLDLSERLELDPLAPYEQAVESVRAELASAPRFAALLQSLGVEVPMKPSPTDPGKAIPALAKTDEAFIALQEHPDETVAAATRARLDVKSTLLETRIGKFLTAARLTGGKLPVPLRYCGADTTGRDSGEEHNPQNLPRIDPRTPRPSDALRQSLRAPKGKMVIVADQSGIELRVNHFLWMVADSMELYRADPGGADLYRAFAAAYYGKSEQDVTKSERQFAKVCQLGLGFGAGHETFARLARTMGGLTLTLDEAANAVHTWRRRYAAIVAGWRNAAGALKYMADGKRAQLDSWGLVHTAHDGLHLPSGRLIRYPGLREEDAGSWSDGRARRQWVYAHGRHQAHLSGPKVVENIVQALARDSIFDASVEYFKRTGLRPALRVHDELVYVVEESHAQALLDELQSVMRTAPAWWPQLVVWSEGGTADSYGQAK